MKTKEIRKLISNVFWDLKRDFDSDMDTRDIIMILVIWCLCVLL